MTRVAFVVLLALLGGTRVEAAPAPAGWFDAARDGSLETLRKLGGKRPKVIVDVVDDRGYTALVLAAYHDHADMVRWLLASGADTCVADTRGFTALMGAVFRGHDDIVKLLVTRPCGADHVSSAGQTPLMLAALFNRVAAVKALLAHGADPARTDPSGKDARSLAMAQGNDEIVALIDAARGTRAH